MGPAIIDRATSKPGCVMTFPLPTPEITPATGSPLGGDLLAITGIGVTEESTVTFGSAPALRVLWMGPVHVIVLALNRTSPATHRGRHPDVDVHPSVVPIAAKPGPRSRRAWTALSFRGNLRPLDPTTLAARRSCPAHSGASDGRTGAEAGYGGRRTEGLNPFARGPRCHPVLPRSARGSCSRPALGATTLGYETETMFDQPTLVELCPTWCRRRVEDHSGQELDSGRTLASCTRPHGHPCRSPILTAIARGRRRQRLRASRQTKVGSETLHSHLREAGPQCGLAGWATGWGTSAWPRR
jgi:hypothetical protein